VIVSTGVSAEWRRGSNEVSFELLPVGIPVDARDV
jgi:hypothetical protein